MLLTSAAVAPLLWFPGRTFLYFPILPRDMVLGNLGSTALSIAVCVCLASQFVKPGQMRAAVAASGLLFLMLQDALRCQPHTVFGVSVLLSWSMCRLHGTSTSHQRHVEMLLATVYCVAGAAKLNSGFMYGVFPWFLEGLGVDESALRSDSAVHLVGSAGAAAAITELVCGVLLLWPKARRASAGLLLLMHILIVISLGPAGHGWNRVMVVWNFGLIAQLLVFWSATEPSHQPRLQFVRHLPGAATMTLVVITFGHWGECFAVYSGREALQQVVDTPAAGLHNRVQQTNPDPVNRSAMLWAERELGVTIPLWLLQDGHTRNPARQDVTP